MPFHKRPLPREPPWHSLTRSRVADFQRSFGQSHLERRRDFQMLCTTAKKLGPICEALQTQRTAKAHGYPSRFILLASAPSPCVTLDVGNVPCKHPELKLDASVLFKLFRCAEIIRRAAVDPSVILAVLEDRIRLAHASPP